jgi:division protein CdvB (Snf7/Vps24/ESCRT-III family)
MSNDQHTQDQQADDPKAQDTQAGQQEAAQALKEVDGLADKKPSELTPEELRLMADTMPGEGPGDD